jgi:hypothetical protein
VYSPLIVAIARAVGDSCFRPIGTINICPFGDLGRSRAAGAVLSGSSQEEGSRRVLDSAIRDTPLRVPWGRPLP